MLCPNCKNEIENGSKFCEHCGARVKKSKKWLWVALAVTFLACVAIAAIFMYVKIEEHYRYVYAAEQGFVDLGLPSGTLWKQYNEDCSSTYSIYEGASNLFGLNLPTKEQFEELQNMCSWYWMGSGYQVTGPNGNSIYLPAAGYRECDGDVGGVGTNGYYWSSTPINSDNAWFLSFGSSGVGMLNDRRCYGLSVRLVMNP